MRKILDIGSVLLEPDFEKKLEELNRPSHGINKDEEYWFKLIKQDLSKNTIDQMIEKFDDLPKVKLPTMIQPPPLINLFAPKDDI